MIVDYRDRPVLVVGGTRGIGLATARAFARRGALVTVTHKWGSVAPEAVHAGFAAEGLPLPDVVEADATVQADVEEVVARVIGRHGPPVALISNVAVAGAVRSVDDYVGRNLHRAVDACAWPLVSHLQAIRAQGGAWPRYVVGVSSAGVASHHVNYDFAAAAKAVLEALVRYLGHRLQPEGVRVNAVSTRFVRTESLRGIMGEDFEPFVDRYAPDLFVDAADVAETIYAVCSGLMDGMSGQVLTADGGAAFADGFSRLYQDFEAGRFGLPDPGPKEPR